MPYDLGVIKRQRREPPVISTSTYGGNFVGFYSTSTDNNVSYYAVHVFTLSGQFTKPSYVTTTTAQVLVVAGGGSGSAGSVGAFTGGGGGAGGVVTSSTYSITSTLTILIGAGGAGTTGRGSAGGGSTVTNGVTILAASGGGYGGYTAGAAGDGGSGGGGGGSAGGYPAGSSTGTQGNAGGLGYSSQYAGGGGGAGAVGGAANANGAGQGGSGTITLITGSPIWVAGGGGGGSNANGYNNGSYGGGSAGGTTLVVAGTAGIPNTGGGGGGGGGTTGAGGAGGSGIVIISYAIPANLYPLSQSDLYFSNNALLLNAGSIFSSAINNIVTNVIGDTSINAWSISNSGSTPSALNPFDPSSYHSLYFNGSAYLVVSVNAMPAITTDFTLEFWMYAVSSDNVTNHWLVGSAVSSGFYVFHRNNFINIGQLGIIIYTSPTAFLLNQWIHVAVVRASNIFYIYQNGISVLIQSWNPTFVSGGTNIGGLPGQGAYHTGYLSNIRVASSAVYTGNFLVPTQQLSVVQNAFSTNISAITTGTTLLTGRFSTTSTSIVDYSTLTNTISVIGVTASTLNPFTGIVTYNSVQFNGNNYLSSTKTGGWLSGTHTVEAWVYLNTSTNASTSMLIAGTYGYGNTISYMFGWEWTINSYFMSLNFQSDTTGYNPIKIKTLATTAINTGGQLLTDISLYGATDTMYFPDFKWNFLYPPNPFNNRYGSFANMNVGNVYGTPTYLASRPRFFGTGNFTFETWIFIEPNTSEAGPIFQGADWALGVSNYSARKLVFIYRRWLYDSSRQTIENYPYLEGRPYSGFTSTSSVPTGQWVHVAFVVTSSNQYNFYINGVQDSSSGTFLYDSNSKMNPNNSVITVGGNNLYNFGIQFSSEYYGSYLSLNTRLDAFISNARIVIGVAVYTGNFTVPTDNLSITQSSATNISAIVSNTATVLLTAVTTASITQQVFSTSTWYHVAFTKSSNIVSLYVNGVGYTSLTLLDSDFQEKNILQIGKSYSLPLTLGTYYGTPLYGNISNFRIVNGTAIYANNFTVPPGPLQTTQVANPYGGTNTQALSIASSVSLLTAKYYSYYQSNTGFVDHGTNSLGITPTGNPGQGTFSPFGNNWSTLFNGTTDHLSIPVIYSSSATLSKFNIGFNDFTIETWAYLTANTGTAYIAGQLNASNYAPIGLYISSNKPTLGISNVGSGWNFTVTSPTAISTGTWNHIAAVRNGTRFSMYVNGVEQSFGFGSIPSADISINSATVVTTNVTNSTLNPYEQGPYHSLYFNGVSHLSLPANAGFNFGTGDFTMECWVYPLSYGVGGNASETIDLWSNASGAYIVGQCQLQISAAGLIQFPYATTVNAAVTLASTVSLLLNAWSHIAVVRFGSAIGNLKIYLNGVVVASSGAAVIQNLGTTGAGSIGRQTNITATGYNFNGYISNVRIVKSLALYTSAFLLPQSPFSTIQSATPSGALANLTTNTTQLLIGRFVNSATNIVDYSTNTSAITIGTGSVSLSTLDPFSVYTGTNFHSLYFSGNGSMSVTSATGWLNYGDHTVEAWVNLNSSTVTTNNITSSMLIAGTYDGATTAGWEWTINPYFMTLNYRSSGVLTSFGTGQLPILSQVIADTGGNGLSPTNTAVTLSPANPLSDGYGSLYFNGTNAQIKNPNNSVFNFGSGSFTIESWVYYLGTAATTTIIGHQNGSSPGRAWLFSMLTGGLLYFDWSSTGNSGVPGSFASSSAAPLNQWNHVAFVRNGTTYTFYINGVAAGSGSMTASVAFSGSLAIGYTANETTGGQSFFKGYISNLRVVKGLAVYTGNFTPTGRLTSTQVAGTNIQAILTASYTSILLAANPAVSSQTFALNTWHHVAFTRLGTTATMYINGVATSSTQITSYTEQNNLRLGYIGFGSTASTYLTGYISNFRIVSGVAVYTGTNFVPPTGILTTQQPPNPYSGTNTNAITFNTSTRIATALFNGLNISPYSTNTNMLIGRAGSAVTSMFPGYLSNLRIVNGTAVYTSNFIPTRAPSTILTNTSLLIAASSRHVDISGNNFIVTTGTVVSLPAITKFTPYKIPGEYNKSVVGGSVYFNTTTAASQNLSLGSQPTLALGSGDYTVELWVYPISYNTANSALIDWRTNAGTTAGVPVLYLLSTGLVQWQNTGGTGFLTSPNPTSLNTWNHISMVRSNSMLYMFINGSVTTSTSDATALSIQTLFINSPITGSNQTLFGYISNIRIVAGSAVYLPTLSVPTTTLTSVTNTVLLTLQNDAPAFKDNSVNNFTLTNPTTSTPFQQVLSPFGGSGSAYFNGKNNYLVVNTGTNSAFAFGNGDFTIEAWIYPTARNTAYGSLIIGGITYTTVLVSADWFLIVNVAGYLYFQIGTSSSSGVTSSSKVSLNVWTHVAVVRLNGSTTFYLNGKLSASTLVASVTTTSTTAGGSLSFNGTSSSLSAGSSSDWRFLSNGTQDWTVETWFNTNLTGERPIFTTSYSGPGFFNGAYGIYGSVNPTTGIISVTWVQGYGNGSSISTYGGLINSGTWYHLAITFISSTRTARIFLNGVLRITSIISAGAIGGTVDYPLIIGQQPLLGYFSGYMSNFRIAKYVKYGGISGTTNFTPVLPLTTITNTQLLLLVSTSTAAFTDSSSVGWTLSNTATVTYSNAVVPTTSYNLTGSVRFDTTNVLLVGTAANWTFLHNALQDYTIECWFYTTSTAYQNILGTSASTPYSGIEFSINYSNGVAGGAAQGSLLLGFNRAAGGQNYLPNTVAGLFSTSTWNHAAVTFTTSTKTVTFFVNGVAQSVAYNNGSFSNTTFTYNPADPNFTLYVGAAPPSGAFNGSLSNVRITKSIVYTGNFILPTTELATTQLADNNVSAILTASYVSLLTAQHFALVDTSTYAYSIVNSGGAVFSSSISPNISYNSAVITSISNTQNIFIGGTLNSTATVFSGYISNLQVLNIPKYSSVFIPHTVDLTTRPNSLLLTLLSTATTIVDSSANSFVITNSTTATTLQGFSPFGTNYSVYFNNSYLNVSNAQSLNLSSSTGWTIETWVNPTGIYSTVTNSILFAKRNSASGQPTYNSIYFNNGYLGIAVPTNTPVLPYSTGDFTIEFWVNFPSVPSNNGIFHFASSTYFGNAAGVIMLAMAASNTGWIIYYGINLSNQIVATLTPAANVWYHIALVRYVNVLKIYINGISYNVSLNDTTDYSLITNLVIGAYYSASYPAIAYVSNFRIVNNLAVYTGDNFNLPYPALETTQVANPEGGINTQAISTSSYTTLLIGKFVGSADAILDYSDYNFNLTSFGSLSSNSLGVGYGGSLLFNGSNQYLTIAAGASTFGTGAWTIECWIYVNLLELALIIIDTRQTISPYAGVQLSVQINGSLFWYEGASTLVIQTDAAVVKTNKWYHIAIVRNGAGQCTIYLNGISIGSGTSTLNHLGYTTYIGRNASVVQNYFNGYISNLRIVTGGAVYTGDFTPSTSQLNNTQTANISGSPSISIPETDYSFLFNGGSTQYLSISDDTSLNMGSSSFTVEAWIYRGTPIIPVRSILSKRATTSTFAGINLNCPNGSVVQALATVNGTSWGVNLISYIPISTATWTHIAFTRNIDTWTLWQNGTAVASQVLSGTIPTNAAALTIGSGAPVTAAQIFQGAISNFRIVKNIAIYTGNFTPSKTQLTSTQTASTNILAITDDVVVNGALAFNGVNQYLTIPARMDFDLSYKSFTMECWVYVTSFADYRAIWSLGTYNATTYTYFGINIDGSVTFQTNQGTWAWAAIYTTPAAVVSLGTWAHVAAVRDYTGNTFKIYVNGTEQFTTNSFLEPVINNWLLYSGNAFIGSYYAQIYYFQGYITNFRLVKGVAVYTGAFTVSTTPFYTTQAAGTNISAINTASSTVLFIDRRISDTGPNRVTITNVGAVTVSTIGPFITNNTGTVLLTAQSFNIVDNSKNNFSIGNAGGVTDWTVNPFVNTATTLLINSTNTATGFTDKSLNNFAITNFNAVNTSTIFPLGINLQASTAYQGYLSSGGGYLGFYDGTTYSTATISLSSGTWSHIAYTYDFPTSSVNVYVNGFRVLNTTATIVDGAENLYIGGILGSNEYFYGYMSNLRIVKGSSLYLGSYFGAVPTSAFTTSTNTIPYPNTSTISTSLLALQTGNIADNSTNRYSFTIGGTGGTVKTSVFAPFAANPNLSTYFNGTTDFINVSAQNALSFGTGDFTIEVWVYPTLVPTSYSPVLESRTNTSGVPWIVGMRPSGGVLKAEFYDGVARTAPTTIQLFTWTHLAWTRTNSTLRIFVNGQIDLTSSNNITNMNAQGTNQLIGKLWDGANNLFQGYMSNLRVVKGISLYTGNFNPSKLPLTKVVGTTTNLLTTFVNIRAVEYSGNTVVKANTSTLTLGTVTKNNLYSINFNGTSDFLSVSSSTGFAYNSNDFTWEMWVYPTTPNWASTTTVLLDHIGGAGGLFVSNNRLVYYNSTVITTTASTTLIVNSSTWTHIAAARSNNITSLFVNGAFATSITDSNNYNISRALVIGTTSTGLINYFQGYIEDVRITKGVARYTASFVPPIKLSNR
jgi:hypothetical protein